jgi:hypothetical protein
VTRKGGRERGGKHDDVSLSLVLFGLSALPGKEKKRQRKDLSRCRRRRRTRSLRLVRPGHATPEKGHHRLLVLLFVVVGRERWLANLGETSFPPPSPPPRPPRPPLTHAPATSTDKEGGAERVFGVEIKGDDLSLFLLLLLSPAKGERKRRRTLPREGRGEEEKRLNIWSSGFDPAATATTDVGKGGVGDRGVGSLIDVPTGEPNIRPQ